MSKIKGLKKSFATVNITLVLITIIMLLWASQIIWESKPFGGLWSLRLKENVTSLAIVLHLFELEFYHGLQKLHDVLLSLLLLRKGYAM